MKRPFQALFDAKSRSDLQGNDEPIWIENDEPIFIKQRLNYSFHTRFHQNRCEAGASYRFFNKQRLNDSFQGRFLSSRFMSAVMLL